ncbi:DUF1849 family protein [Aurantimonas sp. A2-1-M11]|uniref:EipB family protein n=1 Tax=Aurantimonas sp. A2-1-M11 TaxID=3113712 RepID=UPI002F91CE6A
MRSNVVAHLAIGLVVVPTVAAAATIAPHRASYDLAMDGSGDLVDAQGRIAVEITRPDCDSFDIEYRFVARFQQEQELVVTDQQTQTLENRADGTLEFETRTLVDGAVQQMVRGTAVNDGQQTHVALVEPESRSVSVPLSAFPMQHTLTLIERAAAGERIVQSRLYDGDPTPEKQLTTTAIIGPAPTPTLSEAGGETGEGAPATEGSAPAVGESAGESMTDDEDGGDRDAAEITETAAEPSPASQLEGLRSWRVSESFYDSDSDADGLPVFQTAYTLYENGVSDDLVLTFDGYRLAGGLASLDLKAAPDCP